jgi:tRNA(Ile)-lysidine synthetase-like protein
VERAFDRLRLVRVRTPAPAAAMSLETDAGAAVWGEWSLRWRRDRAPATQPRAGLQAWFSGADLVVRSPRAGERIRPLGGRGRRLIVRCLQDARVPRSRRSRWPVVEVAGEVAWVPGVMRSAVSLPAAGMEAVRVDVEQH